MTVNHMPADILSFDQVRSDRRGRDELGVSDANFTVKTGELVLILVPIESPPVTLFDLAQGLRAPDSGTVTFAGAGWAAMRPHEAEAQRARIGRVFPERRAWLSNLNVIENVTLAERHHTRRPEGEILEEANNLAKEVGMPGLPDTRPAWTASRDLRRAQWVRALLGNPRLILLERPADGVEELDVDRLVVQLERARGEGAAVVWLTDEARIWNKKSINSTQAFRLREAGFVSADRTG